jgi:prolycopene isomerase
MKQQKVVVLGGGIAGLTAAALLARRGLAVTLIEKGKKVGGYVTGFTRQGFYFDATGAFLAACEPGGEFYAIIEELGLTDDLAFLPIPAIKNIYPDFSLQLDYRNPAAYVQGVMEKFPEHAETLQKYSDLTDTLGREFLAFEKASWWKKALLPFFFPTLIKYARHSHGFVLERFFNGNQKIVHALSALPTTVPPSRLSYIFVAVLWAKVLKQGVFYPKGGMIALSDGLEKCIHDAGGEILFSKEIMGLEQGKQKGWKVVLGDGQPLEADWLVGAFNPFAGEKLLPGGQKLYGRMFNLARFEVSPSALLFYVGLPAVALPENWPYFVSIHTDRDPEKEAKALEQGSLDNGLHLVITTPSLIDPSLAPAGHHSLKVLVHAPHDGLFEKNYGTQAALEALRERIFTLIKKYSGLDITGNAVFVENATPRTLVRYTGNIDGAMYGFDAGLGQVGPQRPPIRTKLDNLLWVGHYTRPAHGIVGSALSGSFAANIIHPPVSS